MVAARRFAAVWLRPIVGLDTAFALRPIRFTDPPHFSGEFAMGITGIISWCIFGLIVGALARFFMPGRQGMGWIMTIVLGIVGSFAGGMIASLFTGTAGEMNPAGWIMSVIGAMIVLFVYSKLSARGPRL